MWKLYLVLAIIIICIAHLFKVMRWRMFIQIYEKPNDENLIQALSFGYIINFIIPYRIGDFFRGIYSGRKMKNRYSFSFATILVDRVMDIICVGIIFLVFFFRENSKEISQTLKAYITISLIITGFILIAITLKNYIKTLSKSFASIFNRNIEYHILKFFWSVIWGFKDIVININKINLILCTIMMWFTYSLSYLLFTKCIQAYGIQKFKLFDMFILLFSKNTLFSQSIQPNMTSELLKSFPIIFGFYCIVPLVILFIISKYVKMPLQSTHFLKNNWDYLNLLPQKNRDERLNFLEMYFSGDKNICISNYLKINRGISIITDCSAGSNATTILCLDKNKTFFRKYSFVDADKLHEQIEWIKKYNALGLPLPKILKCEKTDDFCYYDMPYDNRAITLFKYAHSMPYEKTWDILKNVLKSMEKTVYSTEQRKANREAIALYIQSKVTKNLNAIQKSSVINELEKYDYIIINGEKFKNLKFYLSYLTEEKLIPIFENDVYSGLHGDLTIENIVCMRNYHEDNDTFYIIDPNTGNIHDSSNLDYAKLLQSLHGGYEFLMQTRSFDFHDNEINFLYIKSYAYLFLYKKLDEYMSTNFSSDKIKSIYFHEIIHWLRLMPYKIDKDKDRVLLFYSGLLIVLNDVIKRFGDENNKK